MHKGEPHKYIDEILKDVMAGVEYVKAELAQIGAINLCRATDLKE